jgi:hypothetical protein
VSYGDPYGLKPCNFWLFSSRFCSWADMKENVGALFRRLRSEPEQVELGREVAPHIFSLMASGTLTGPVGRSVEVNIPGPVNSAYGKVDYVLGNVPNNAASAGKGGFFRGILGFDESTMGPALQKHLVQNTSSAVKAANGNINVTGAMVGANGRAVNVTSVWRLSDNGKMLNFVTAMPASK